MWPFKRRLDAPSEERAGAMSLESLLAAMQGDETDLATVARSSFTENTTAYGSIMRIMTAAQAVPWLPQRETRGGDLLDVPPAHDVHRILRTPNPWHTWGYVVGHMLGSLLLDGNAYAWLNGPTDASKPREIIPLPFKRVRAEHHENGDLKHYKVRLGNSERTILPDRMWHAWLWNPDDPLKGQAPTRAAAGEIALSNSMRKWNRSLVRNSARPSGIFMTDAVLDDQRFTRLENRIQEKYAGGGNAGRPLIAEGGLKWMRDGLTPAEMDWTRGLREVRRDISTALGVAPELMGDPETKTYANALHARLALYEDAVLPLLNLAAHSLVLKLRRYWPDLVFTLDVDATPAMQERRREYANTLVSLIDRGIITRNEARQQLGWEPLDGADELLVPMHLVPLDPVEPTTETPEEDDDETEDEERKRAGPLVTFHRRV